MSKTRTDYGPGVARPKIDNKDQFELKGQFLKELRENTFSGSDHEDANEHIEKVLEIVDLFHVPNITVEFKESPCQGFAAARAFSFQSVSKARIALKIPGAITLSLFTTVDSREEGAKFEVTGFDKAFVSPTLGKAVELGRGVTTYSLGLEEKGGLFPSLIAFAKLSIRTRTFVGVLLIRNLIKQLSSQLSIFIDCVM
ncbi:hypothetical protein Tco_1500309 [Tanacetum coccineum]